MYHYFHNKEDLYMYILEIMMAEKARFLTDTLQKLNRPVHELGFFDTLVLQLGVAIEFGRAKPRYHKINLHLQNMPDGALKGQIWGRFNIEFDRYMSAMVDQAISKGEIREGLNKNFVLRVMRFVLLKFTDFYPDYAELLQKEDNVMMEEMEQLVDFIRHGLQGHIQREGI
jgi:TetR/AcrR family transcriptional regulator